MCVLGGGGGGGDWRGQPTGGTRGQVGSRRGGISPDR